MHVLHSLSSACIAANSTGSHNAFKFPHNVIDKRSDMCFPKAHHSGINFMDSLKLSVSVLTIAQDFVFTLSIRS